MKRIVKRYYDEVQLKPERKQAMLVNILKKESGRRYTHGSAWKVVAAVAAVAAIALAVTLPLTLGGDISAPDQVAVADTMQTATAMDAEAPMVTDMANTVVGRVVMDINPSVEFQIGEDGMVITVIGLNEDGVALVDGIEFAGLSLENATIMVVNQLILQEYITAAQIQKEINLSFSGDSITLDTMSIMTDIIETAAAEHNIAVDVIADEDENALQIVLEGEGNPEIWPGLEPPEDDTDTSPEEDKPVGLEVEFVMADRTYSAYVDNVLIHTKDGETIDYLLDFVDSTLKKAALFGIVELIEKEYITDTDDGCAVRFSFTGSCTDSDISAVAYLTELLIAEYGLKIVVLPDLEAKQIMLEYDETVTHEAQTSRYAIKDVLNHMVNKDEEDLSPRQIAILKAAFTYREYQRLMEKRYFVVIPDLVGMSEEQAVDMLLQLNLVPGIVREKAPGYDPSLENGGLPQTNTELSPAEQDQIADPVWDFPVVDFGCVFYQDGYPGGMCQTGLPIQINVIMPEDYDGPESISDYKAESGIVLREMDVPFDVFAYPDTFLLSEAEGFDAMIGDMNATYPISNKADYTVTIDKNTGWEDTAVISITHKDGFPQSKYFVQEGRIIEVEFMWRRGVPTAEEG